MTIKKTALVLQGGAALGAYEYGVIRALYENDIRPEIITGVSIGAFNAGVLGGARDNNPIQSLERLWRELLPVGGIMGAMMKFIPLDRPKQIIQLAGNPHMYSINPKLFLPFWPATSFYNTSRLHDTLEQVIDLERINGEDAPHVVVNAVDVKTGALTHFENKNGNQLTIDHLMASGSVAPLTPATVISDRNGNENHYWDGGFYNNTPMSKAIHLLQSAEENSSEKIERELIVAELFPRQAKEIPENLERVTDRIFELLASSKIRLDLKLFERIDSYIDLIHMIDEKLPHDEDGERIRNHPAYQSLISGHKKIDRRLVITLQDPESVLSMLDFSRETIERRINSGYDDTVLALKNSDFA
jgi:NTE family protein